MVENFLIVVPGHELATDGVVPAADAVVGVRGREVEKVDFRQPFGKQFFQLFFQKRRHDEQVHGNKSYAGSTVVKHQGTHVEGVVDRFVFFSQPVARHRCFLGWNQAFAVPSRSEACRGRVGLWL